MNFDEVKDGYLGVLKKYTVFEGRARRKEYWTFTLVNIIVFFVVGFIGGILGLAVLINAVVVLYSLAILLPSIAVAVRRLHDTGRSGWWYLLVITIIGAIVLLVFMVQDSAPGENEYGPNPKE